MSVYYENGQLSKIVFSDKPQQSIASHLVEVGTKFIFAKGVSNITAVAVHSA